jgi:tetratricopeptide (TPR) repeat protein
MAKVTFILACMLSIAAFVPSAYGQTTPQPGTPEADELANKAFLAANELMDQQKPAEALVRYKEAFALRPDSPAIPFNAGLAAYLSGNYYAAVDMWKKLKTLDPTDWQARAKLVQAYQALGRTADRDTERSELFELRKSGQSPELSKQEKYCREQFTANGLKVMVFEHFELKGDRALRYVFSVLDNTGKAEAYRISLGSYEDTNAIWREATKPTPKKGERLFHLDSYSPDMHATYGMFSPEPSYEETRAMVVKVLEGKSKALSSTTYGTVAPPQEKPKP